MTLTPSAPAPINVPTTVGVRKIKGASVRSWLLVESNGQAQVMEVAKHAIMRRTGLQTRDLRILDPVLSYPSTISVREQSIVVNLEYIKAIITAQGVLFVNSRDPLMNPFFQKLQGVLRHRKAQEAREDSSHAELTNLYNVEEQQNAVSLYQNHLDCLSGKNGEGNADGEPVTENAHQLKVLPIEFVALEACLEAVCSSLDNEARRLEQEARSALDKLTSKISTLNLERVRQIKGRSVAMTRRVHKVRDELERLLDDDEAMAEMYLTDKLEQQQLENSFISSINELNDLVEDKNASGVENRTFSVDATIACDKSCIVSDIDVQENDNQQLQHIYEPYPLRRDIHRSHTSTHSLNTKILDVKELEMILEAYFVLIDGTLNKLSNLKEYVEDTEDYINIMLDDKQNNLLQMGITLTSATLVLSAFVAVTGVFGMNIRIELTKQTNEAGPIQFLWTVGGGTAGCIVLYAAAMAWYRHKRLLE